MSLKAELEAWAAALKAYDEEDFEQSLEIFSVCLLFPSSPYVCIYLTLSCRALPTLQKSLQIWASFTQLSANMKLPYSSLSQPPALTTTLLSRQYPYLPDPLRHFSLPSMSVTSNAGFRISCLVVMIAPPRTLRRPCFIYEGISQCMQLELPIFFSSLFADTLGQ